MHLLFKRHLLSFLLTTFSDFQDKCGPHVGKIWPYLLTEIGPTLKELGILTPEEMGYDKPELACKDVFEM